MATVELASLTKSFGDFAAVHDLSLYLNEGEILALLGPSGSGKTTTLRLLAGFETPTSGQVLVDGQDVTRLPAVSRRFGMVFQHYALFPHLNVGQNVAFGLESAGLRGDAARERVRESLELVDLAGFEGRAVSDLSGGQQQRVALARALAPEPRVLLLDEPLSNLDPGLRERTRRELRNLIHRIGITTVLVTHEQEEAFDLGDRIALLRNGTLQQVGTPDQLYTEPANAFVTSFVGRSTMLEGAIESDQGGLTFRRGSLMVPLDGSCQATAGLVRLFVRPEAVRLISPGGAGVAGRITARRFLGASALFRVEIDSDTVIEAEAPAGAASEGDEVGVVLEGPGIHCFPAVSQQ